MRHARLFLLSMLVWLWPGGIRAQAYDGSLLAAVRSTLEQAAVIKVGRQQVLQSEGQLQSVQSEFDATLQAGFSRQASHTPLMAVNQTAVLSESSDQLLVYSLGLNKKFRSGLQIAPTFEIDRADGNYSNTSAPASSRVALNFVLPLLQGRGSAVNTAPERAAQLEAAATELDFRNSISNSIVRSVLAYWGWLAASRSLEIARASEERARILLEDAGKLVKGDVIAAADLPKYRANLSTAVIQRLGAEQVLLGAVAELATASGVAQAAPPPADDFPPLDGAGLRALADRAAIGALAGSARQARFDARAVDLRLQAAQILRAASAADNKARLDLNLSVGYNGLVENRPALQSLAALGHPARGPNAAIGISYSLPLAGDAWQGQLRQRSAQAGQRMIEAGELGRVIELNLRVQISGLQAAAQQLEQATQLVLTLTRVLADDKKKYRLGYASVLDLLTSESQLTNSQLLEVNARRSFAEALIRLRHESGTLLDGASDAQALDRARLCTIPVINYEE